MRRRIGDMPFRRRQDGLTTIERREERKLWGSIISN